MKGIMRALVLFLCFVVIPNICLADKIDKADNLVKKGIKLERVQMYDEARKLYHKAEQLIKEAIINDPDNPDLHFRAGIVYLHMNKPWEADRRFDTVCNVLRSQKYCQQVTEVYRKAVVSKMQIGRTEIARLCYKSAVKFNPLARDLIAKDLFVIGRSYLNKSRENNAYKYFKLASQYSNNIKTQITKSYLKIIRKAKGRTKIFLCLRALEFDKKNYLDEIIKIIGDEVKKIDPTTEERERYEAYVLSHNLIPRDRVKEAFYADYRVLKFGIYYFDLKKGEGTPYITVPYGYGVASIDSVDQLGRKDRFIIRRKNYDKNIDYETWKLKKWIFREKFPFKLISMENQKIKLVIGKYKGFKLQLPQ